VAPFSIPIEDGGGPDGDVDLTLTLSFGPVPGRTYFVGARLLVGTEGLARTRARTSSRPRR
jgi:hypothetical protein